VITKKTKPEKMLGFAVLYLFVTVINAQLVAEDILCEGRFFEPSCARGTVRIISASFGKTDSTICGGNDTTPWSVNCGVDVADYLRQSCQGRSNCSVRVEGQDVCVGTSKYLQVIWACDSGIPQNRVNNRGANIVLSNSPARAAPVPLHSFNVAGSQVFIFLDPSSGISQVRWYLDQPGQVLATENVSPFDFHGGRPWNSTETPDGQHRIIAALTFSDGATGTVDATFNIGNAPTQQPLRVAAVSKASDSYVEPGTTAGNSLPAGLIPWSLFGGAFGIVAILGVIIVVMGKGETRAERA